MTHDRLATAPRVSRRKLYDRLDLEYAGEVMLDALPDIPIEQRYELVWTVIDALYEVVERSPKKSDGL